MRTTGYLDISLSGSLKVISDAIDQVAGYKAEWGAGQNRLEYTVSNLMNVVEFTSAARSRIQDADFARRGSEAGKSSGTSAVRSSDACTSKRSTTTCTATTEVVRDFSLLRWS